MTFFAGTHRWEWILVVVIMATLGALELLGVFFPHFVTITRIIKAWIPMPVRFMVYAWVGWHFIVVDLIRW